MLIQSLDRDIHVKELTNKDKRAFLKAREDLETPADGWDPLNLQYEEHGLLLSDMPLLFDLTTDEWDVLTETDQLLLIDESKRVNPLFFEQIIGRLMQLGAEPSGARERRMSDSSVSS
jgi:hypothetical protein